MNNQKLVKDEQIVSSHPVHSFLFFSLYSFVNIYIYAPGHDYLEKSVSPPNLLWWWWLLMLLERVCIRRGIEGKTREIERRKKARFLEKLRARLLGANLITFNGEAEVIYLYIFLYMYTIDSYKVTSFFCRGFTKDYVCG